MLLDPTDESDAVADIGITEGRKETRTRKARETKMDQETKEDGGKSLKSGNFR